MLVTEQLFIQAACLKNNSDRPWVRDTLTTAYPRKFPRILDLAISSDIRRAIHLLHSGEPLVIQTQNVFGLMMDASRSENVRRALVKKGKDGNEPVALMLPDATWICNHIDTSKVDSLTARMLKVPTQVDILIEDRLMLRFPIRPDLALHSGLASGLSDNQIAQALVFGGQTPGLKGFVKKLWSLGMVAGVTSFNEHGETSITDLTPAINQMERFGLGTVITTGARRLTSQIGSFDIVSLEPEGPVLIRKGNFLTAHPQQEGVWPFPRSKG